MLILGGLIALDKKVLNYISCTLSSFLSINHPTFHSLFAPTRLNDTLKDESHYRKLLTIVYENVKSKIKEDLSTCVFYSFTTDIWSGTSDDFIKLSFYKKVGWLIDENDDSVQEM